MKKKAKIANLILESVVASILGYSTDLGYRLDFPSKVTFAENAQFNVSISDEIVILELDHIGD